MIWLALYLLGVAVTAVIAWRDIAPTDPGAVFAFPKWPKVLAVALLWPGAVVFWIIDVVKGTKT
jgi:hypothetical protein